MNELQKKELELLKQFIVVCDELKIPYYLVCGTALGAAKYQGFIPWDDDMDVGIPRESYERFLQEAPALLPDGLFLQNYRTDPQFPHVYSKLRDSNTTYIEREAAHLKINHGIYIDIFPLDGYPVKVWEQRLLELRKKIYGWMQYCALTGSPKRKVRIRNRIFRFFGFHKRTARTLAAMERMYRKYSPVHSQLWCNHGNWQGKLEYAPRWQYGEGIGGTFEGVTVRLPEKYDEYLTQKYGDWRADLPESEQYGHHFYSVCDVNRPYTDYIK